MRLLFDQNLSYRIVGRVADLFPASAHVRDFGLADADDSVVWQFATDQGYVIVSKDDDFRQRSLVLGFPPKVVWLRVGNCTTDQIVDILRARSADVLQFDGDPSASVLVLSGVI